MSYVAAWVLARLCKLQKGCTQLAATNDKVYQLLAHGRWFSPGTLASSTTKTGRHDIAGSGIKHNKSSSNSKVVLPMNIIPAIFNSQKKKLIDNLP